ncbi:MAG: hypothetical protein MUE47_03055 [Acidobacteria bacterium]|jgi:hypothetical protein|nr:hypothetical protein [Acidobacteriota bacterium]
MVRRSLLVTILLAGLVGWAASGALAAGEIRTVEEATKAAAASGKLVLIDCTADW